MFNLAFTGTGGALPLKNRGLSAAILSYAGRKILFDCGENTQQSFLKLHAGFSHLDLICLTHLHGDHLFGLPGLLCTMGMSGRLNDLLIIAPLGSKASLSQFLCLVGRLPFGVYLLEMGDADLERLPYQVFKDVTAAETKTQATDSSILPSALAFSLTKQGLKLNLFLSDPTVLTPLNFSCLIPKKSACTTKLSAIELLEATANLASTNSLENTISSSATSPAPSLSTNSQSTNRLSTKEANAATLAATFTVSPAAITPPTALSLPKLAANSALAEQFFKLYPECNLFAPPPCLSEKQNSKRHGNKNKYQNLEINYCLSQPSDLYLSSYRQKHSVPCLGYRLDYYKAGPFSLAKACAHGVPKEFFGKLQQNLTIAYDLGKQHYYFTPSSALEACRHFFSFGYITDTRPVLANQQFLKDIDVLVSEANYPTDDKIALAIKNRHMTLKEACQQAQAVAAKNLILTHFSAGWSDPANYLETANSYFAPSFFAEDLCTFNLQPAKRDSLDTTLKISMERLKSEEISHEPSIE